MLSTNPSYSAERARLYDCLSGIVAANPVAAVAEKLCNQMTICLAHAVVTRDIQDIFDRIEQLHGRIAIARYKKLLCLYLMDNLSIRLESVSIPKKIKDLYPGVINFILTDIIETTDDNYLVNGNRIRDLKLLAFHTLPVGAELVDIASFVPNNIYRYRGWRQNMRNIYNVYGRLGGRYPLLRKHTDVRYLDEFNASGFHKMYHLLAELLQMRPELKGVVGTSWFYDPQLEHISPHLVHLRKVPLEGGAVLIGGDPDAAQIPNALAKSRTRKRLFEQGSYVPRTYTMLWPRKAILKWAKNNPA